MKWSVKGLLSLSAVLGTGGLLRFLAFPGSQSQPVEYHLGPSGDYPPGSSTLIPQADAILFHTQSGFHALSLVCTHLGCTVNPTSEGFACPCHNSHYDADGKVLHGPAARSLQVLQVKETADGRLILSLESG